MVVVPSKALVQYELWDTDIIGRAIPPSIDPACWVSMACATHGW
jgi:hypothetical protein